MLSRCFGLRTGQCYCSAAVLLLLQSTLPCTLACRHPWQAAASANSPASCPSLCSSHLAARCVQCPRLGQHPLFCHLLSCVPFSFEFWFPPSRNAPAYMSRADRHAELRCHWPALRIMMRHDCTCPIILVNSSPSRSDDASCPAPLRSPLPPAHRRRAASPSASLPARHAREYWHGQASCAAGGADSVRLFMTCSVFAYAHSATHACCCFCPRCPFAAAYPLR